MTTGTKTLTVQLPYDARHAVWRIFGNGLAPLKQRTWCELVEPIIRQRLGRTHEADRVVAEILRWFDPEGAPNHLRTDMNEAVAEMIVEGIGVALQRTAGIGNHHTAFWAMSSIHPDVAASIVRDSWCTEQIDAFAAYALDTLQDLHETGDIRDPQRVMGERVKGAKVRPSETGHHDLLRTFQVGGETSFQAWRLTYPGIPSVVDLLLDLKPEMLPELVRRVQDPLLQGFAAFCAAGFRIPPDHHKPLQWVADTSPAALIALAILYVMAIVRETEFAAGAAANPVAVDTTKTASVSDMVGDLVDSLAGLEPAKSVWWLFELLNYTSFGPNEKPPTAEMIERHCAQSLEKVVLDHWSVEVVNELEAGLRRATLEPRGKPLADVASRIRDQRPGKARQISGILLDEHERRMTAALAHDSRSAHLSGHWNQQEWLIALGLAVVIHHDDIDPLDWAINQCNALPLSAWDADEQRQVFRRADEIAQVHMIVGLYAVQSLREAGRSFDCDGLRNFVERVWAHSDFVRRNSDALNENSGAAQFAGRVAVALGALDQQWLLQQAKNPAVDSLTLWALLDQIRHQEDTRVHVDTATELRQTASYRYINAIEANRWSAPYLANLWVLLDAPEEAANTADVLLSCHQSRAVRTDAIPVLKMLAFAASRGALAGHRVSALRALYDDLWGQYTPREDIHERHEVDAFLNQSAWKTDEPL